MLSDNPTEDPDTKSKDNATQSLGASTKDEEEKAEEGGIIQSSSKEKQPEQPKRADSKNPVPTTELQIYGAWFMSDVLIYVTVLNLAAEWVESIKVTSYGFSILAALILKLFLDVIVLIEHWFQQKLCVERKRYVIGAISMWAVVFGSKFIILWIDDVIFGTFVELGGFIQILVLAVVLMILEKLSRLVYRMLGKPWTAKFGCLAKSEEYREETMSFSRPEQERDSN